MTQRFYPPLLNQFTYQTFIWGILQPISKKLFNENYRKFKHYSKGENFSGKEFRLIYTDFKHTRNGNIESLDITYILRKGNQKKNIEIVVRGCIKSKESWLLGEKIDFPSGRVRENQGGMYFYPNY